jgi:hypothetical protein
MKITYITFTFIAILLALFISLLFIDIPSPGMTIVETYTLEIK